MLPTLLITNDFPPRVGGIQSYVFEIARRLPADQLVVLASSHPEAAAFDAALPFPVLRHPGNVLLPTPRVARHAQRIIARYGLRGLWYGAAAPLGLLTPALRPGGIIRTVASTHGHEIGWSMLPGTRQLLRRIGQVNDVLTFVSSYARRRIAPALGPHAVLERLSPGVAAADFHSGSAETAAIRQRHQLGAGPVVCCISRLVPRKGQDVLIRALPEICRHHPQTRLLIVGDGPYRARLEQQAARSPVAHNIIFTGPMSGSELPAYYAAGDVFAMPCRTRGGGLDVEGLGIVFLEAAAAGRPVVAGNSGGAPETIYQQQPLPGQPGTSWQYPSGRVVDGRNVTEVAAVITKILDNPQLAEQMGHVGQQWVTSQWTWDATAQRLSELLSQ